MTCSTSCPTQDHETYGACLRAKAFRVGYCQSAKGLDRTTQKRWDKRLDSYRDAKRQGIQPKSTRTADIRQAVETSNQTGTAFVA